MADENPGSGQQPGNPAPDSGAGPQTPNAPTPDWTASLPEPHRNLVTAKGWKEPAQVLDGYANLEKFLGADKAGRGVVIPGEGATPEERAEFNRKLGVPDKPDAYAVTIPDGFPDPTLAQVGPALLHKHNIPKASGDALLAELVDITSKQHAAEAAADEKAYLAQEAELRDTWGGKYDQNMEIAKRGMAKLGFTQDIIDQIEVKSGFGPVIKAMHQAGVMLGEGRFVDGGGGGGAETLEQLEARRHALVNDRAWSQRFHANEATAQNEYAELERKIKQMRGT
jgi:hypothetical protein